MTAQTPTLGAHFVAMIGVPGAGKSKWVTERFTVTQRVNLDLYREMVADTETDMGATNEAVAIQGILLTGRLRRGLTTVLDSTNVDPTIRREQLAVANRFDALTIAVVLDATADECMARNQARADAGGRFVPPDVIRDKHRQLYVSFPPGPVTGFQITRRIGPDTDQVFAAPGINVGLYEGARWLR